MIKILKKDTIVDIVEKIHTSTSDDIILDFPLGHPILHNHLSLKVLKNTAGKKKIVILSSDLTSRKIWRNIGIKYSMVKDRKFIEESSNSSNLIKYNFTFFEYFSFEVRNLIKTIKIKIARNKKINTFNRYYSKYNKNSNVWIFLWWLAVSILLFIFIFYFAVNKTYVYITPEVVVKTRAKNFVFKEELELESLSNDITYLSKISKKSTLSKKFTATGIDEKSIRISKWKVTMFNKTLQEQQIVKNTRLQTEDGIIYQTLSDIVLPAAIKDNFENILPWSLNINVESQIKDIRWDFIGERWNIWKWVRLSLPWLTENKELIYGETISEMKWGKDAHTNILSEVDLENAKSIMDGKLKSNVVKELSEIVRQQNIANKTNIAVLWIDEMISYSDQNLTLPENIEVGTQLETFTLEWNITAETYTYDKEAIINKLRNVIRDSILEGTERIIFIDNKSLRVSHVLTKIDDPLEIKATAEIEVLVSHDFLNNNNSYVEKLKSTIKGLEKKEAITLLLNDTKISSVDIKIRPFFIKKISNINDNIIFKVEE